MIPSLVFVFLERGQMDVGHFIHTARSEHIFIFNLLSTHFVYLRMSPIEFHMVVLTARYLLTKNVSVNISKHNIRLSPYIYVTEYVNTMHKE